MNSRQTYFVKDEWNNQKTNVPVAQLYRNTAPSYGLRPINCPPQKFHNTEAHFTQVCEPKAPTINPQFNAPSSIPTSCPTVNLSPYQNAIYSPRVTYPPSLPSFSKQTTIPTNQVSNFQLSERGKSASKSETIVNFPVTNQFSQNPVCTQFYQASDSSSGYPNVNSGQRQKVARSDCPTQFDVLRNHPVQLAPRLPNSLSTHNVRFPGQSPGSNVTQHENRYYENKTNNAYTTPIFKETDMARPFLHPSNKSDFSGQMHSLVSNKLDFTRQMTPSVSNKPNFAVQIPPPVSNKPDFTKHLPPPVSNYRVQPPVSHFSSSDFIKQPPAHVSIKPDSIPQLSPLSCSNNANCFRQPVVPVTSQPNFSCPPPLVQQPDLSQPPPFIPTKPDFVMHQPPNFQGCSLSDKSLPLQSMFPASTPDSLSTVTENSSFKILMTNFLMPVKKEECKLANFLERFSLNQKRSEKNDISVVEFRTHLKKALFIIGKLMACREKLSKLLQGDENDWNLEVEKISNYKKQLTQECDFLAAPVNLTHIQESLESRKRKRKSKKKFKQNKLKEKADKLKNREELHQEIDKLLDSIKEKNLKLKREAEMKKEADSILSEVRRKIQVAKRMIEKIKIFEKLRSARQAAAIQKGLILPDHDKRFQRRILELKNMMLGQLSDYESEEKALKVMLEAEQEGQLEEEALWRIKKLKTLQQRRQNNIIESLFGNTEEPTEDEHMFLFYQYHNSANKSIENLVQIRNQWDMHLNEGGEAISPHWVVPVPPSSAAWEISLA